MLKITHLVRKLAFLTLTFIGANSFAQVGIGTTVPRTSLDVNGAFSLRSGGTLTLANGNNSNIVLPLTAGVMYSNYRIIGPTALFNIGSIVPATGADGQIVTLQNTTNQVMQIRHNASGAAANRILIPSGLDLYLTGQFSSVTFMYSAAQARWILQDKLSDETIWYYPPTNINANTTYTLTATIPNCTNFSAVSVNLSGDWLVSPSDDITIHHVEARTGEVRFIVSNNTSGANYNGMDFIISVRN